MSKFPSSSRRSQVLRWGLVLAALGGAALLVLRRDDVLAPARPVPPVTDTADRMAAELLQAAQRADMCTSANPAGVGLRGEYFDKAFLKGSPRLVRTDGVVDFDQAVKWPSGTTQKPVSSVRWSGWVRAPISGGYRFHADAPGMRVLIARKLVAGGDAPADEKVELAAGRFYPIEVTVDRLANSVARIRLEWTAPHGARYVVPKALLNLPTETATAPKA
ncbi:PA14 domain-containing protein [Hydrogenophaga palleronii]|uniref:PA14 domain-containing protein n=1 Tax=Hydrogenophaga palleronii TaxID=65655 RepID=UPI0009FFF171|nr:PA14 domain-containing protein [Hydrogenophaga palleronii]